MVEGKKEVLSVGNLTEHIVESNEDHVAGKSETLGGESQLGEDNSQVMDSSAERVDVEDGGSSCNGDKIALKESDFKDNKEHLEDEGVAVNVLSSKRVSEANIEENAEFTDSSARTEETKENQKPELENKNTEQHDDVERADRADKGEGALGNESVVRNEEENNEMDIDHEDPSKQENEDKVDEMGIIESEAVNAIPLDTMEAQNAKENTESILEADALHNEMDIDHGDPSQQENEDTVDDLQDEMGILESEAVDAVPLESMEPQNTKENTERILESEAKDRNTDSIPEDDIASGATKIEAAVPKEKLHNTSEGEEKGALVEADSVNENLGLPEEENLEAVGVSAENVGGDESVDASIVEQEQIKEVSPAEANEENSKNAKEMEIEKQDAEERNDNVVVESVTPGDSVSKEPTDPDGASEGSMVLGQGELQDHTALFDPNSDIVKYIDFSGVLSGDSQEIKNTTTPASAENNHESQEPRYDDKATVVVKSTAEDMEIEKQVTDSDNPCQNASEGTRIEKQPDQIPETKLAEASGSVEKVSKPVCNVNLNGSVSGPGSEKSLHLEEDKVGKKFEGQDMQVEEQVVDGSKEKGSDGKVDNKEHKADTSVDESLQENSKTISMAKVSISNQSPKSSFKIGECIARAASQMAAVPSILKGNNLNLNNENLSPEKLLSQLHRAATSPAKGDNYSDIFTGFFSDYRNSVASEQTTSEKVCGKRNKPSSTVEAFEFEDMSDTYWTDRVIHEGGEEQQPENEKQTFQIVPVELKPAQTPRTRRPYKRRKFSDINSNISHLEERKPAHVDENAPAELVMNFAETDRIPSETNLSKMFRHFGPIRESLTEVDSEGSRARVVFKKCSDAAIAYDSAGKFSIFGTKVVNYELNYTITEHFKVQPYVVSLGEEHEQPLSSF